MKKQPGGYTLEELKRLVGQKVALFGGGCAANVFEIVRLLDVWADHDPFDGGECLRAKVETNDWRSPFTPYLVSYGIGKLSKEVEDLPLGWYCSLPDGVFSFPSLKLVRQKGGVRNGGLEKA